MRRDYENILNQYAGYQIHYYVLITNSHQVAKTLTSAHVDSVTGNVTYPQIALAAELNNVVVDDNGDELRISKRQPFIVTDETSSKVGKAVFLIDSRSDADFIVERFKVDTVVGDDMAKTGGFSNSFTIEGEINIYEPYSASLVQLLQDVTFMDSTTSSIDSNEEPKLLFFVIQPFIVPTNLKTDINNTDDIKLPGTLYPFAPNIFMMLNFSATCDVSGTAYSFSLVSDYDGISKLPVFNNIVATTNVTLDPFSTLYDALMKVQDAFNNTSETMKKKQVSAENNNPNTNIKVFYPKFVFHIDEAYKSGNYVFGKGSFASVATNTDRGDVTLTFKDGDVTRAITYIAGLNQQIMDDMKPNISSASASSKNVKIYEASQLIVTTEYDSKQSKQDSSITINVYIKKRKQYFADDPNGDVNVSEIEQALKTNIAEYDYIYTGKNINVIDFKMSVVNGFAFTMAKNGVNLLPGAVTNDTGSAYVRNDNSFCGSNLGPGAAPLKKCASLTNNIGSHIKYYDLINKVSFVESLNFEMNIIGDVIWYNSIAASSKRRNPSITEPLGDWHLSPTLVKLNIQYPISPNFWEHAGDDYKPDFSERVMSLSSKHSESKRLQDFWYRGLIRVLQVETVFEGNNFYHNIRGFPLISAQQQIEKVKKTTGYNITNEQTKQQVDTVASYTKNVPYEEGTSPTVPKASAAVNQPSDTFVPPLVDFLPIRGSITITSTFGEPRTSNANFPYHKGIDIRAAPGTNVYAMWAGILVDVVFKTTDEVDVVSIYVPEKQITYRFVHIELDKDLKQQFMNRLKPKKDAKGKIKSNEKIIIESGMLIGKVADLKKYKGNIASHLHVDMYNCEFSSPTKVKGFFFNPLRSFPENTWKLKEGISKINIDKLRLPFTRK